jgi:hypothetical protein
LSPRTSEILSSLAAHASDRLTVGDILSVLRGRAFALLIVLLGLPNCLPMPPPIPLVCGFLLAFVAIQIALGRSTPWLPRILLNRSVARVDVERAVRRVAPVLRRLERFSRPRMSIFESGFAFQLTGVVLLLLSVGIIFALPPIVGQIPLAVGVCLVGLGLVERDGLVVLGGLAVGSIGLTLSASFVWAVVAGFERFL